MTKCHKILFDSTRLLHSSADLIRHFIELLFIDEHASAEYLICILDCLSYTFLLTELPDQLDVDVMERLVLS